MKTVERERACRTADVAGRDNAAVRWRGRAATREGAQAVREVLEGAVLADGGE